MKVRAKSVQDKEDNAVTICKSSKLSEQWKGISFDE